MIVKCDNTECKYNDNGECIAEQIELSVEYNRSFKWVQVCLTEESEE